MVKRLLFSLVAVFHCSSGWIQIPSLKYRTSSPLFGLLPSGYEETGEALIRKAGESLGVMDEAQLDIKWKAGRIIVTVHGDSYMSNPDDDDEAPPSNGAIDVTELAKAINRVLDDDGVGLAITESHEIEVTTPGVSDELEGVMFEAYQGFDVLVQFMDQKTKKIKTIEGRLHERDDDITVINIKGRMKKLKNTNIVSVKLPKAKKEKGVN